MEIEDIIQNNDVVMFVNEENHTVKRVEDYFDKEDGFMKVNNYNYKKVNFNELDQFKGKEIKEYVQIRTKCYDVSPIIIVKNCNIGTMINKLNNNNINDFE